MTHGNGSKHVFPENPEGQLQLKSMIGPFGSCGLLGGTSRFVRICTHVPPFWQGLDAHGSSPGQGRKDARQKSVADGKRMSLRNRIKPEINQKITRKQPENNQRIPDNTHLGSPSSSAGDNVTSICKVIQCSFLCLANKQVDEKD
jgi:hypothetical protein